MTDIRLTASAGAQLINHDLNIEDTYPPHPLTLRPQIMAGYIEGPVALAKSSVYQHVADQNLQGSKLRPVKWIVMAEGWMIGDPSTDSDSWAVACTLGNPDSKDRIQIVKVSYTDPMVDAQGFELLWYGTLYATSKVTLSCLSPANNVMIDLVRMTAFRAGTLLRVPIHP